MRGTIVSEGLRALPFVLVAAGAAPALGPWLALGVALPLALAAILDARRRRALAAELFDVEIYASALYVEGGRLAGPDAPPAVRSAEARALVRRIAEGARALAEAERAAADAREERRRTEAVRARFTVAMGHELKTPLASIVGFSSLLERRSAAELGPAQRESVAMIRRAAHGLLFLLGDLLDSAKLDAGRLALAPALVPAAQVLADAVQQAQSVADGRAIVIEPTFQPGLPPVRADRARLVQAIVGVFRHVVRGLERRTLGIGARRATGAGGAAVLRIEIVDPQRAVDPADTEQLFEALGEPGGTGRGPSGGLGLALSLARRLVRLHGGDLAAEAAPGGGTCFVITVPLEA